MNLLVSNYETRDTGAYFIAPIALAKLTVGLKLHSRLSLRIFGFGEDFFACALFVLPVTV